MRGNEMWLELADGLRFPESPRWHDGALWFAEKRGRRILRLDGAHLTEAVTIDDEPGGIGWDEHGDLLVVSMLNRQVLKLRDELTTVRSDLASLTTAKCNDMVVHDGRCYVGDFGYDLIAGESARPGVLVFVDVDGSSRVVAEGLEFPNGAVVTADGKSLIVAESSGNRLTMFTIGSDGSLDDRRVFAELGSGTPDGICLDSAGAVWYADPLAHAVVRVDSTGHVLDQLSTGDESAFACALGGPDMRTLFVCTDREGAMRPGAAPAGQILSATVEVPGT